MASKRWRVRPVPEGAGAYFTGRRGDLHVYLHRLIAGARKGEVVDHINGNSLDNRKANLRICTKAENSRNRKLGPTNKSGFKGVSWEAHTGKWRAKIGTDHKQITIGRFDTKEDAARAYNEAAIKYHGPFARLNQIP